jgi:hypothetical protein
MFLTLLLFPFKRNVLPVQIICDGYSIADFSKKKTNGVLKNRAVGLTQTEGYDKIIQKQKQLRNRQRAVTSLHRQEVRHDS